MQIQASLFAHILYHVVALEFLDIHKEGPFRKICDLLEK